MRFESSGSRLARDAAALLDQRRGEVRAGTAPPRKIPDHTFGELAARYSTWMTFQKAAGRKEYFVVALKSAFEHHKLRAISPFHVEQYRTAQLAAGRRPATCNRHLACLTHMLRKAVEWEMLEETALKRIRGVKALKEENQRLRFLSVDEAHALVAACDGVLRDVVICGLSTGMRREEILGLTWPQVDLVHGLVRLDRTKSGESRTLPISAALREVLERRAAGRDPAVLFVFVDRKGHRLHDLKRSFHTALRKAGITDFRFHDLRHTFASHLVMGGVDLATVKDLLGHADVKMTLRYSHLAPGHRRQAVDRLALVPPTATDSAAAGTLPYAAAEPGAHLCLPAPSPEGAEGKDIPQDGRGDAASTVS